MHAKQRSSTDATVARRARQDLPWHTVDAFADAAMLWFKLMVGMHRLVVFTQEQTGLARQLVRWVW